MLVLSRKRGENMVLPQIELTITVISIEGQQVRLGFSAPDEVKVYREEVWHRLAAEIVNQLPGASTHMSKQEE